MKQRFNPNENVNRQIIKAPEEAGEWRRLINLNEIEELDSDSQIFVNENGENRCNYCGYDRGVLHSHTGVEYRFVECRHCEHTIHDYNQ